MFEEMMNTRLIEDSGTSGYESDVEDRHVVRALYRAGGPMSRRRRDRTHFTKAALLRLEAVFTLDRYPDIKLREDLAAALHVTEDRIQVWFQNRRSKQRKRQCHDIHDHSTSRPTGLSTLEHARTLQALQPGLHTHTHTVIHTPPGPFTPGFHTPGSITQVSPYVTTFVCPDLQPGYLAHRLAVTPNRTATPHFTSILKSPLLTGPPSLLSPVLSPFTNSNNLPPFALPMLSPDVATREPREGTSSFCLTPTPPRGHKFIRPWESPIC